MNSAGVIGSKSIVHCADFSSILSIWLTETSVIW